MASNPHSIIPVPGMKAYLDSFAGLVACEIVQVNPSSHSCIRIRVTARKNPSWKFGELFDGSPFRIVPRAAIRRRKYGTHIARYPYFSVPRA
jgi:hypothetical protein